MAHTARRQLSEAELLATDGIVLRTFAAREADLVVRVFSPDLGKFAIIAKSARKSSRRFGGGIEVFDRGKFTILQRDGIPNGDSLGVVQDFVPSNPFTALRNSLEKLAAASLLCECLDKLSLENAPAEVHVYELFELGLQAINDAGSCKEALRGCFLALGQILVQVGFLAPDQLEPPSGKALVNLIQRVESCVDKEVVSKTAIVEILKELKTT